MRPAFRSLAVAAFALAALSGCSAISSISSSSTPLQTYALSPSVPAGQAPRGSLYLLVDTPTASAALATDRIAIKPTSLSVEYLPDGRWPEDATRQLQLLLVRSLSATGRFGLVTAGSAAPTPDYVLLTDLTDFQARTGADGTRVEVAATLTVVRDADRRIVAARRVETSAVAASTATPDIVNAFERATAGFLADASQWIARVAR